MTQNCYNYCKSHYSIVGEVNLVRAQSLLFCTILLAVTSLTACTRERATPEPTATSAATAPAEGQGGAEPVVEVIGSPEATASPSPTPLPATETPEPEPTRGVFQHTVGAGETLSSIAERYSVAVQQLRVLNNLTDDSIFAGQILRIPEGEPTPTPEPFVHTVQVGETLSSIAARYGVNTNILIEVNNILDPNALMVGASLLIPGLASPSDSGETEASGETSTDDTTGQATGSQEVVTHLVQQNETISGIAASYGVSVASLTEANGLINPNLLRAGQVLVIPGVTQRQVLEARGVRHTVQSGESLSGIASLYDVTVAEIMSANGLTDPNTIVVGQELLIPQ